MMERYRGLIEKLREFRPDPFTASVRDDDDPPVRLPINPDGPEAADLCEELLTRLYVRDPEGTALLCDEKLDPSGALLGRVREHARGKYERIGL
jgi:hypothetical protein